VQSASAAGKVIILLGSARVERAGRLPRLDPMLRSYLLICHIPARRSSYNRGTSVPKLLIVRPKAFLHSIESCEDVTLQSTYLNSVCATLRAWCHVCHFAISIDERLAHVQKQGILAKRIHIPRTHKRPAVAHNEEKKRGRRAGDDLAPNLTMDCKHTPADYRRTHVAPIMP
jgi:hypothetical protein